MTPLSFDRDGKEFTNIDSATKTTEHNTKTVFFQNHNLTNDSFDFPDDVSAHFTRSCQEKWLLYTTNYNLKTNHQLRVSGTPLLAVKRDGGLNT